MWTRLEGEKFEQALTARAEQWHAEHAKPEDLAEPAPNVTPRNAVPQNQVVEASAHSTSQKQVNEKLEAVNENLGKMNTRLEKVEKMEDRLAKKIDDSKSCCTVA